MTRVIRVGLIQASLGDDVPAELESIKTHMIEKHMALIDDAANQGVEVLCLQELFYGPYFCAE
ncbi:MAG: acyltransferase, partial [Chloroflexi bacterium]|nr:acyltransferase [Chloroflexota bacterium]